MQTVNWKRVFVTSGLITVLGFVGLFGYVQYNISKFKYQVGECLRTSVYIFPVIFEVKSRNGLSDLYDVGMYSIMGYSGVHTVAKTDLEDPAHDFQKVDCNTGKSLNETDS